MTECAVRELLGCGCLLGGAVQTECGRGVFICWQACQGRWVVRGASESAAFVARRAARVRCACAHFAHDERCAERARAEDAFGAKSAHRHALRTRAVCGGCARERTLGDAAGAPLMEAPVCDHARWSGAACLGVCTAWGCAHARAAQAARTTDAGARNALHAALQFARLQGAKLSANDGALWKRWRLGEVLTFENPLEVQAPPPNAPLTAMPYVANNGPVIHKVPKDASGRRPHTPHVPTKTSGSGIKQTSMKRCGVKSKSGANKVTGGSIPRPAPPSAVVARSANPVQINPILVGANKNAPSIEVSPTQCTQQVVNSQAADVAAAQGSAATHNNITKMINSSDIRGEPLPPPVCAGKGSQHGTPTTAGTGAPSRESVEGPSRAPPKGATRVPAPRAPEPDSRPPLEHWLPPTQCSHLAPRVCEWLRLARCRGDGPAIPLRRATRLTYQELRERYPNADEDFMVVSWFWLVGFQNIAAKGK